MIELNLFGNNIFNYPFTWSALFAFALFVVVFCMILSWYYSKIKSRSIGYIKREEPIYGSKDILLQEKKLGLELIPLEKITSVWVKAVVFILIFLVTITPLYQLLGTDYFI
ncbi:hypothetical protein [uncultured Tenacibaculum sp.]|uniref:hypothetical protein n=1 Tax=uncultured Tenacibaculum sp. TaxID=174713 RepID=UPI0026048290|nr:hypothetical protein [uncultured Tenacibaculum sp.]